MDHIVMIKNDMNYKEHDWSQKNLEVQFMTKDLKKWHNFLGTEIAYNAHGLFYLTKNIDGVDSSLH